MDNQEKAKIIAIAKTLGSTLSDSEILEKYSQYYQEALDNLSKEFQPAKTTIFPRPF